MKLSNSSFVSTRHKHIYNNVIEMDFKCFKCEKEFTSLKDVCNHLKIIHLMKDQQLMSCVVKNNICSNTFSTFNGLLTHAKKCKQNGKKNDNLQKVYSLLMKQWHVYSIKIILSRLPQLMKSLLKSI